MNRKHLSDETPQAPTLDLICVSIFSLALCLSHIHQGSLAVDAVRYAQIAKNVLVSGNYLELFDSYTGSAYHNKPPMMFWGLAAIFKAFGFSTFFAKLPSAIFASISMILFWLCARLLFNTGTAYLAVLLFCANRYFSRDLVDLNFESMAVCGALFCLFAIIRVIKTQSHSNNWYIFLIGTFLLSQSKPPYLAFVILPSFLALYQSRLHISALRQFGFWVSMLLPIIVTAGWYISAQSSSIGSTMDNQLLEPMRLNVSYEANLLNWLIAFFSGYSPMSILGLGAVIQMIRQKRLPSKLEFILLFWLLPLAPIVLIAASRERYLIIPMLAFGLLGAQFLAQWLKPSPIQFRRALAVLACVSIVLFTIIEVKVHRENYLITAMRRNPQLLDDSVYLCVSSDRNYRSARLAKLTELLIGLTFDSQKQVYTDFEIPELALPSGTKILTDSECQNRLQEKSLIVQKLVQYKRAALLELR